jgi:hypothetical protein
LGSSFFKVQDDIPERRDALVWWPHKLIVYHSRPDDAAEYYDLEADPAEKTPLAPDDRAARIRAVLKRYIAATREGRGGRELEYGGAAAGDLRALGYIE